MTFAGIPSGLFVISVTGGHLQAPDGQGQNALSELPPVTAVGYT